MRGGDQWEDVAISLARLARTLLDQASVQDTLDEIVSHAVQLVGGWESAGIMVVKKARVETVAWTDELARISDRLQGESAEGRASMRPPRSIGRIASGDMDELAGRWPRFVPGPGIWELVR